MQSIYAKEDKILGQGAFGTVYLGVDISKDEYIALKEIPKYITQDPKNYDSLINEILISTDISNDNCVKILEVTDIGTQKFIAYEYCNGSDLKKYLDCYGYFNENYIQSFLRQTLNGLSELHRKKIVHHDIKPENLLVVFENKDKIDKEIFDKFTNNIKKYMDKKTKEKTEKKSNLNTYQYTQYRIEKRPFINTANGQMFYQDVLVPYTFLVTTNANNVQNANPPKQANTIKTKENIVVPKFSLVKKSNEENEDFNNEEFNINKNNQMIQENPNEEVKEYLHEKEISQRLVLEMLKEAKIKVSDFGLSKINAENEQALIGGSPLYMAPELFVPPVPLEVLESTSVDIWALGVLCFELFFGYPPFDSPSGTQEELVQNLHKGLYYINMKECKRISKHFLCFLNFCLQKKQENRRTVEELLMSEFITRDFDTFEYITEANMYNLLKYINPNKVHRYVVPNNSTITMNTDDDVFLSTFLKA